MLQKLNAIRRSGREIDFVMTSKLGQPIERLAQQYLSRRQQQRDRLLNRLVGSRLAEYRAGAIQYAVRGIAAAQTPGYPVGSRQQRRPGGVARQIRLRRKRVANAEVRDGLKFLVQDVGVRGRKNDASTVSYP